MREAFLTCVVARPLGACQRLVRTTLTALALMVYGAGAAQAAPVYWNVFNIEGESVQTADLVTYGTLMDMPADTNRLGVFQPLGFGAGRNVVGSGSDGSTYWNVFNIEGESVQTADFVTYGTLMDMLLDTNRLGVFQPLGFGAGRNVVGSGAGVLPRPVPEPLASVLFTAGVLGFAIRRARCIGRGRMPEVAQGPPYR